MNKGDKGLYATIGVLVMLIVSILAYHGTLPWQALPIAWVAVPAGLLVILADGTGGK